MYNHPYLVRRVLEGMSYSSSFELEREREIERMTIIGLFRRYKRWNPVHPTYGAFWGLGIGAGCGVGWGPGFGPDSVGFVGGGCGLGFSIGITFVGIGIGLPASGLTCVPYNALSCASCETVNFAKYAAPLVINATAERLKSFSNHAAVIEKNLAKGVTSIQSSQLATSVEANLKKNLQALEKNAKDCQQNLGHMSFQALNCMKEVCHKNTTANDSK